MDWGSIRGKSGSEVRTDRCCENPPHEEKQESGNGQGGDSLSQTLGIVRIGSRRKCIDATDHGVHQGYHDHGGNDTAE